MKIKLKLKAYNKFFLIIFILLFIIIISFSRAYASVVTMKAGTGFVDSNPKQIVRANDDRVYFFSSRQFIQELNAYWAPNVTFPTAQSDFSGHLAINPLGDYPISVDTAYNGGNIIHVLVNLLNGHTLKDYPFDITTHTFKSPITLASGLPSITGDYIGSVGVSSMFDVNGMLNIAYWISTNHIMYAGFTYNSSTNSFSTTISPIQIDTSGFANHPILTISPKDESITIAWVSEATTPKKILARTYSGSWGSIENVSSSTVWFSTNGGINIDQTPTLVIDSAGKKYLAYIQDWDSTNNYGKVHYVTNSGSGWVDNDTGFYTHDPAIGINSAGEIFVLGHGFSYSGNGTCSSPDDLCLYKRITDTNWSKQVIAVHDPNDTLDGSTSVKFSRVGYNRPETLEFVAFAYNTSTVYYGYVTGPVVTTTVAPTTTVPTTTTIAPTTTIVLTTTVVTTTPAPVKGDFNGDRLVNTTDLSMFLANLNTTDPTLISKYDLNSSNSVNITDLSILLTLLQ